MEEEPSRVGAVNHPGSFERAAFGSADFFGSVFLQTAKRMWETQAGIATRCLRSRGV